MKFINKICLFLMVTCLLGTLGVMSASAYEMKAQENSKTFFTEEKLHSPGSDINKTYSEKTYNKFQIISEKINITSKNKIHPAYIASPTASGKYPAVVLIHSFNGFQPAYKDLVDKIAADGYVVIAPFWQTYSQAPPDTEVEALIKNTTIYLDKKDSVDSSKLGLTGFCAGGRYTMLFLPQIKEFKSGVAWYGFPYASGTEGQPRKPVDLISKLDSPILIIHGTRDQASNISDIYRYAGELDAANKYFELKVYQGEPHSFMLKANGNLSQSFVAKDAYKEMISFFDRTLNNTSKNSTEMHSWYR
jgi:carboxymethylenebutenolidase